MEKEPSTQMLLSSDRAPTTGVDAIIGCINELVPIKDKDYFYNERMIARTEECNASLLDETDKAIDKLMSLPLTPSNMTNIERAVKRLSRTITKSYKGYLDAIVLAQFYSQSPDKLFDQLSHLYNNPK